MAISAVTFLLASSAEESLGSGNKASANPMQVRRLFSPCNPLKCDGCSRVPNLDVYRSVREVGVMHAALDYLGAWPSVGANEYQFCP